MTDALLVAQALPSSPLAPIAASLPTFFRIVFSVAVLAGAITLVLARDDLHGIARLLVSILLSVGLLGLLVTTVYSNLHFTAAAPVPPPANTGPFLDSVVALFVSASSGFDGPVARAAEWIAGVVLTIEFIFLALDLARSGAFEGPGSILILGATWLAGFSLAVVFASQIGQINGTVITAINAIGASMAPSGIHVETPNAILADGFRVSAVVTAAMPRTNVLNPLDDLGLVNLTIMRLAYDVVICLAYAFLAGEVALAKIATSFAINLTAITIGFAFCRFTRQWAMMWPQAMVTCGLILITLDAMSGLGGFTANILAAQIAGHDASVWQNFMQVFLSCVGLAAIFVGVPGIVALVAGRPLGLSGGSMMVNAVTSAALWASRTAGGGAANVASATPFLSPSAREAATVPPIAAGRGD